MALQVGIENRTITGGEGRAQAGGLTAAGSCFDCKSQVKERVCIYTDSFAIFEGCTEGLPFWEENQWVVNRVPVWQTEKWQEVLAIARKGNFLVGWVASHQENDRLLFQPLEQEGRQLGEDNYVTNGALTEKWDRLWNDCMGRQHAGTQDLCKVSLSRGWPL